MQTVLEHRSLDLSTLCRSGGVRQLENSHYPGEMAFATVIGLHNIYYGACIKNATICARIPQSERGLGGAWRNGLGFPACGNAS